MNYKEYLTEEIKQIDPDLQKSFNLALRQVFTKQFLAKMSGKIKDFLIIKEVEEDNNMIAYNVGNKIFINKSKFYEKDLKGQTETLLHEFIHILQRKKGFLFSKFKEIRDLTNKIYKLIQEHSEYPMSVFLTGKYQNLGQGGKWEVLSYFMNNNINWNAIDKEGKRLIILEIKTSGIFNVESQFWKEILK